MCWIYSSVFRNSKYYCVIKIREKLTLESRIIGGVGIIGGGGGGREGGEVGYCNNY